MRFSTKWKMGTLRPSENLLSKLRLRLFSNASEYAKMESDEEKRFFQFLAGLNAESELTKSIEEKVNFAKKNMRWRKQYMTWQQTIDEEKDIAFEEGREEGREECRIEAAENLLREGDSPEKVARCIGLPLKQVMQIKERILNEECVAQN